MKKLLILSALFWGLTFNKVNASENVPVELGITNTDPTSSNDPLERGSVFIPLVSIDGNALLFQTPCNGYVLRLLDEVGIEVYSTVITSSTLLLPTWLSGEYELQLIPEDCNYYFTGMISL